MREGKLRTPEELKAFLATCDTEYGVCASCGYEGEFPIKEDHHGDEHFVPSGKTYLCPNCNTGLSKLLPASLEKQISV